MRELEPWEAVPLYWSEWVLGSGWFSRHDVQHSLGAQFEMYESELVAFDPRSEEPARFP